MALQTRAIKRRIKSVRNTRKITKAMELVAGSKMRKAVNSVLGTRPYADLALDTVRQIGRSADVSLHPLLASHETAGRVLLILVTSDRGLAGGFNANMVRKTMAAISEFAAGNVQVDTVAIGRRGADAVRRAGLPLLASFSDMANNPRFEDVLPIGRMVIDEYSKGTYRKVLVAHTHFLSAINQRPTMLELLPFGGGEANGTNKTDSTGGTDYLFEPTPRGVLDKILPRLVEAMVYQAVLESAASEHSARMMAMRNASDAAGEMIGALTFTFNQARQAGITQEIAEISSGKAALET